MTSPPGFFLDILRLEPIASAATATTRRLPSRRAGPSIAIEQFDAQPTGQVVFGFGDGWNELEYNPSTGRLWRWTSDRAASGSAPRRSR